jgi:hypothetical protein
MEEEFSNPIDQFKWQLNDPALSKGIYILRAGIEGNWYQQKMIKQ